MENSRNIAVSNVRRDSLRQVRTDLEHAGFKTCVITGKERGFKSPIERHALISRNQIPPDMLAALSLVGPEYLELDASQLAIASSLGM